MADNNGSQFATRDVRTHDLVTGEKLMITFFPQAGVVTINGYSVNRSQKLQDLDKKGCIPSDSRRQAIHRFNR